MPRAGIERSPRWALTQTALRAMKADYARNRLRSSSCYYEKAQVYWPRAERVFTTAELQAIFTVATITSHREWKRFIQIPWRKTYFCETSVRRKIFRCLISLRRCNIRSELAAKCIRG